MKGLRPSLSRLASLTVSATVAVTLWEGAKTLWSRERRKRIPPIVEGRSAAPLGAMNAGWVTLLVQGDDRPLARGLLMLRRTPPRASNEVFWEGEIRRLHFETEAEELTSGPYRVRLAESGGIHPIHINDVKVNDEADSFVLISWLEPEPPAALTELGGH